MADVREQIWHYFGRGWEMRLREFTVEEYTQALSVVLWEDVPPKHRAMLREHFNAPNHTTTWRQLAKKVGYRERITVHRQYGDFAKRIARELGVAEKPQDENDNLWWLWVLVNWTDDQDKDGDTAFMLRPRVSEALRRLGAGARSKRETRSKKASR